MRRTGKREHEYEVVWEGDGREDSWLSRTELQIGYKKMLDERPTNRSRVFIRQRKLTTGEIQKHLDCLTGTMFAEHTRMGALQVAKK